MQTNLSGQTLGKYELRELLGEGGMGAVYRAYDHNLKREVAVKIINLAKNDTALRGRFIREAETAASLEHSHIVRIYDYGVERDINYIVMQNLTGGALSDRMKQATDEGRPRASLPEVALLLEQLASALDYAHALGVIHRDIKPQNVMFNNQGQAFIVDFGIAKLLTGATNMTVTGMAMGTPSYMSPEQWRTDDIVPASDQYALAVMTYQLIAGRLPFEADTPMRVMYRHLNDQPTPLNTFRPDIPADLLLVMDRALSKNPDQRFPNCTQFAQAFVSAVSSVRVDKTNYFTFKLAVPRPSGALYTPTPNQQAYAPRTPGGSSSLPEIRLTQQPTLKSSRNLLIGGLGALAVIGILAVLLSGNRGNGEPASAMTVTAQNLTLVAAGLAATDRIETREVGISLIATDTRELTSTPEPTATHTDEPTSTASDTSSPTSTDVSTNTPTTTASSTLTDTATAMDTEFATVSSTATNTATITNTPTLTSTMTPSASQTASATPSTTPTATVTDTPTQTNTATQTSTETLTATATLTVTATPASTSTPTLTPTIDPLMLVLARTPVASNDSWTPFEADFGGVTMMLVPAGCFNMGSNRYDDEKPVHEQCFDLPFWIDKTEVTQAQFQTNHGVQARGSGFSGDHLPVEQITWLEANDYCRQRGGRLPNEAQWEYAARGPESWTYPWGNTFVGSNLVYSGNSNNRTASVGSRPTGASWVGALDMSGNVLEWTGSLGFSYPYNASDGREEVIGSRTDIAPILRGGSWGSDDIDTFRAAIRGRVGSGWESYFIGFRCIRDFDSFETTGAATFNASRTPISRNADWNPIERDFDGVTMMLVPAGCFDMGSENSADEEPVHEVCFEESFWIDKTEVTQEQFREHDGRKANANQFPGDNRPVENITWFEADTYCEQRDARLPTEAEWEYTARGPNALIYPWGNQFIPENVVYIGNSRDMTSPVESRLGGASWVGALDLLGNVWEYTSSLYIPYPYDSNESETTSKDKTTDSLRVQRGGSWYGSIDRIRSTIRVGDDPNMAYSVIGFRCARDFNDIDGALSAGFRD